jgi:hypothetical protein
MSVMAECARQYSLYEQVRKLLQYIIGGRTRIRVTNGSRRNNRPRCDSRCRAAGNRRGLRSASALYSSGDSSETITFCRFLQLNQVLFNDCRSTPHVRVWRWQFCLAYCSAGWSEALVMHAFQAT